ncbi:transcriptional regulator, LytTR family [Sphingomonas gellani]|uniref:Transcriptional regulator, LytTR family n=1 Tax=Sphingomonas gellani TaxID=1166340 RepID=A0A1H8IYT0_9SPHN|nr:LytTR family DNA-binding domain-containing protein [Sphingomonas gellani]SEN73325.1 transcriptional regulator, LytTR family [Sphingomonas gellani]
MTIGRKVTTELAVLAAGILLLAVLGPFGTYTAPLPSRLLQWGTFLLGGYVFFRPVLAAGRALARQSGLPQPMAVAAACLFGALPTTLLVALVFVGYRWRSITVADLAATYVQVLIVGVTVTLVQALVERGRGLPGDTPHAGVEDLSPPTPADCPPMPHPITAPNQPPVPSAAILDLLPPHLGRDLICLENEDHYVRAHTPLGSALILMRMRDAAQQLGEEDGSRVHRSWWVARRAVVGSVRHDRNVRLLLVDGREVPVARANVADLRARGWLDGAGPA